MTKRAESKYKINRRLGVNLWGRPKSPINKREYGPGQHGQRRKKATDFGTQLMAKQKLRAATIRVEVELWERIECLARQDRRPVANYLALVIADAIAAQSAGADRVAA